MRKVIIAALSISLAGCFTLPGKADSLSCNFGDKCHTKWKWFGCRSEATLDRLASLVDDKQAWESQIAQSMAAGECLQVDPSDVVIVEGIASIFNATYAIHVQGRPTKLFMSKRALERI